MHRIVFDTNIYLSAFLFSGKPRVIVDLAIENRISVYISYPILHEIQEILKREKFLLREEQIDGLIREIEQLAIIVYPKSKIIDICRDSEDHIILECAVQSKADFIVTGDKDLLVLGTFLGTEIISPTDYLQNFYVH